MEKEYITIEGLLNNEDENEDEGFILNINEFEFDYDDDDYDYYGSQETARRLKEELGLPEGSRALALAKEMAEKEAMENARKKERQRLYKTDKKCYNISKDDKNCQKDKTEDRIYTQVNIRKIKKLLKYEGITYEELAKKLGISKRTLVRRFNVENDLLANEFIAISEILGVDIKELIYKNKH